MSCKTQVADPLLDYAEALIAERIITLKARVTGIGLQSSEGLQFLRRILPLIEDCVWETRGVMPSVINYSLCSVCLPTTDTQDSLIIVYPDDCSITLFFRFFFLYQQLRNEFYSPIVVLC